MSIMASFSDPWITRSSGDFFILQDMPYTARPVDFDKIENTFNKTFAG